MTSTLSNLELYTLLDEPKHLFLIEFSKPFHADGKYYCSVLFGYKPVYYSPIWLDEFVYEFEMCNDNNFNVHTRHGPAGWIPKHATKYGTSGGKMIIVKHINEKCNNR